MLDPDVILLDVMLPDLGGVEVLHRIRTTQPHIPVLFLTAKDAIGDRAAGLTAGGDDYVTTLFSLEEVVARLRVFLCRAGVTPEREDATLVVGALTMDQDSHEVSGDGQEIRLTATEFERISYAQLGALLSKAQILDRAARLPQTAMLLRRLLTPCSSSVVTDRLTGGTPLCEMLAVAVTEVGAMLAELALGAFNHLWVAEVRVTSVVNDTDPAVPTAWRELVQRRVADDGVVAVPQRSTAEMDYLFLADVDAVVPT